MEIRVETRNHVTVILGIKYHEETAALLEGVLGFSSSCKNEFVFNQQSWFDMEVLNVDLFLEDPSPLELFVEVTTIWGHAYFKLILFEVNLGENGDGLAIMGNRDVLSNQMEIW